MTDLIERAKAVTERLDSIPGEGKTNWIINGHFRRSAAVIRELIARVEAMGPIAGEK